MTASLADRCTLDPVAIDDLINPSFPWQLASSCHMNIGNFAGDGSDRPDRGLVRAQRRICAACPVARFCAVDALKQIYDGRPLHGMWAGVNGTSNKDKNRRDLAAIAGLPDDHYLVVKTTHNQRRRQEVLQLHRRRWGVSEIAKALDIHRATVERILAKTGHSAAPQKPCTSCATTDPPSPPVTAAPQQHRPRHSEHQPNPRQRGAQ